MVPRATSRRPRLEDVAERKAAVSAAIQGWLGPVPAGEYGGGLCNTFSSGPTLTSATFVGNRAPHGSGICNVGGSFTLVNGIVWGNRPAQEKVYIDNVTPSITYSDIEGGFPGMDNINVDPRLGVFADYGGPTQVFPLLSGSPVIDRGSP